ncbi:virulence factor BrkB domain protein [Leptospira broomii serovar Hurstbridge str. 5399]|uniref:Virulence factor BrkB domain protein n=1 Tax=Leptospira broomii serovar Hurstbridge str. 5399 TaxID=1049789 RepID=T0GCW5_9LEPT|nr:YhjD/YihY/BrkB family envelope integrity protein [Leptospira broomii]EQA44634.1 virulence factor BrkB domain protein [Leptospira broomii serovar Hurstbridge str. 5399]
MSSHPNHKYSRLFDYIPDSGILRKLNFSARVLASSAYRFVKDDCLMKASGISYTTIVSLIPMFTVALSLLTITSGLENRKEEIFDRINAFFLASNINLDINPYLETIGDLIDAARQIGAIGFVILVFSATAVLRSLENSFNGIWRIDVNRSFLQKFVFYFFILSIGPLLIVIGQGLVEKMTDFFRPPHYLSMDKEPDGKIWIAGESGNLFRLDKNLKNDYVISEADIDLENIRCVDSFGTRLDFCKKTELKQEDFIRVLVREDKVYAISRKGLFLNRPLEGSVWNAIYFENTQFSDFEFVSDGNFYFIFGNGEVLHFFNQGRSYKPIFPNTLKIQANRIYFPEFGEGYLADEDGNVWKSEDGGVTWTANKIAGQGLKDIHRIRQDELIVAGERGSIYKTTDSGQSWKNLSHKRYTFQKVWSVENQESTDIFLLDSLGNILVSIDGGEHWNSFYVPVRGKVFASVLFDRSENGRFRLLNIGEYEKISLSEYREVQYMTTVLRGGDSVFSPYNILRLAFPLTAIWWFFLALFTLIPNTKVPIRASSIGAAFTSLIFLFFLYGFKVYVTSFSETTMIVYKALAAIPIFLIGVYSLSMIVLYGAEITACVQFPERYLVPFQLVEERHTSFSDEFRKLLAILKAAYSIQKQSKLSASTETLAIQSGLNSEEIPRLTKNLSEVGLLSETSEGTWLPVASGLDLTLGDFYRKIPEPLLKEDPSQRIYPDKIREKMEKAELNLQKDLDAVTFRDLIDG